MPAVPSKPTTTTTYKTHITPAISASAAAAKTKSAGWTGERGKSTLGGLTIAQYGRSLPYQTPGAVAMHNQIMSQVAAEKKTKNITPKSYQTTTGGTWATKITALGVPEVGIPGAILDPGSDPTDPSYSKGSSKTTTKGAKAFESTTATKTEYAANMRALLGPYVAAAGQLPQEYQSLLGDMSKVTDYTPEQAVAGMLTLAKKYSPNITPQATGGALTPAINKYETELNKLDNPTTGYEQALKGYGNDLTQYEQVAPYHAMITALFNRIRYTDIYEGGQFPGVTNWPHWLKTIYQYSGGVVPTGTKKNKTATPFNYKLPTLSGQSPLPTSTPTSTGSTSSGGSGSI